MGESHASVFSEAEDAIELSGFAPEPAVQSTLPTPAQLKAISETAKLPGSRGSKGKAGHAATAQATTAPDGTQRPVSTPPAAAQAYHPHTHREDDCSNPHRFPGWDVYARQAAFNEWLDEDSERTPKNYEAALVG